MWTEISRISVHSRVAWRNESTSNRAVLASKNVSKFKLERLHAVSSMNMYSLHGFDALMRPSAGQVCHSLTVVSNCTPGSAHDQAAKVICSHRSRARIVFRGLGTRPSACAFSFSVRQYRCQGPSACTASMNSLVTRTELLLFCPETVKYAFEFQSVLYSSIFNEVTP